MWGGVLSWVLLNVRDAECEVVLKHERDIGNLLLFCRLHVVFCWSIIKQGLLGLGNGLTMMPGDTKPSALPIAADATVGACQNCSVLHQVKSAFCYPPNFSFAIFCDKLISQQFVFSCVFFLFFLQNLNEYVSSFLALKQKIVVSEWVLTWILSLWQRITEKKNLCFHSIFLSKT